MPSVSQAQQRAMAAAASGRSTLGIPKRVGKDFLAADRNRQRAQADALRKLPERKRG